VAAVLKVFGDEPVRARADGRLDDQRIPEGEGVLLFKAAGGDDELRFY
jgi:hypothetical protein